MNIQDPIEDYLKIYSESDPITFLAKFSVDLNGDGRKEIFLTNKASLEMPEEVKSGWLFYASSDDGYDRFGLVGLDINHTRVIQLDSYETPKGRKTFPGTVLLTYTIEHEAGGLPSAYAYYVEDGFAYHQKLGFVDDEEFLKRVYEVDPVEIEIIDVDK